MTQDVRSGLRVKSVTAVAVAAVVFGGAATPIARTQPTQQAVAPGAVAEIPVVAPEVVRIPGGRGRHGQRVQVVSLTQPVSFADLDLSKSSDAAELRNRVRAKARAACKELDQRVPPSLLTGPADQTPCVSTATAEGLAVANQAIAAANGK